MSTHVCEIAVVGGGPAGAAAARAAHLAGRSVLLLERDRLPREKICGEYLCPGAVRELRALGFGRALDAARSAPLFGMRLFAPSGLEVGTAFPEGKHGLSIRRVEVDPLLVEASGATILRGAVVTAVRRDALGVTLSLRDGDEVRASLVIGADGRQSMVARELGLRRTARGRPRAALHGYLRGARGLGPKGEMHLPGDGSYVGLNPGPDGHVNVTYVRDLAALPSGVAQCGSEVLLRALASVPSLRERFRDAEPIGPTRVLAPLAVATSAPFGDRVLLAGDAAGFLDPLTGEGMHGAIVSGRLAGEEAARALARGRTSARALARYGRAYRSALGPKRMFNLLLQQLLASPRLLEFLGRRLRNRRALADGLIALIGNTRPTRSIFARRVTLGRPT